MRVRDRHRACDRSTPLPHITRPARSPNQLPTASDILCMEAEHSSASPGAPTTRKVICDKEADTALRPRRATNSTPREGEGGVVVSACMQARHEFNPSTPAPHLSLPMVSPMVPSRALRVRAGSRPGSDDARERERERMGRRGERLHAMHVIGGGRPGSDDAQFGAQLRP